MCLMNPPPCSVTPEELPKYRSSCVPPEVQSVARSPRRQAPRAPPCISLSPLSLPNPLASRFSLPKLPSLSPQSRAPHPNSQSRVSLTNAGGGGCAQTPSAHTIYLSRCRLRCRSKLAHPQTRPLQYANPELSARDGSSKTVRLAASPSVSWLGTQTRRALGVPAAATLSFPRCHTYRHDVND